MAQRTYGRTKREWLSPMQLIYNENSHLNQDESMFMRTHLYLTTAAAVGMQSWLWGSKAPLFVAAAADVAVREDARMLSIVNLDGVCRRVDGVLAPDVNHSLKLAVLLGAALECNACKAGKFLFSSNVRRQSMS